MSAEPERQPGAGASSGRTAALGYTTREVARLLDLTAPRIRSFVAAGFLEPRRGARGEYRFNFQDLIVLRVARELEEAEVPLRRIRGALRKLASELPRGRSLAGVRITAQGHRVVVREGGEAWEAESGQRLLDLDVARLAQRAAPLARRAAERADGLDGLDAEDWFELACELEATGEERAEEAYRRAVALDAGHADAWLNLGRLVHEAGRLEEAEVCYRRALERRGDDATAAFNLGVVLQDLGRAAPAVEAYRRAVEIDPRLADAYFNLAGLYQEMGERTIAIQNLKEYRALRRKQS